MPREFKKRGRRGQQKRKRFDESDEVSPKRQRIESTDNDGEPPIQGFGNAGDDFVSFGFEHADALNTDEQQFYGLLDAEEQAYYANVNSKISANDFDSDDDRALFIAAVHRETQGKEFKVALSQSCSRYLEKIILLSSPSQLVSLFSTFLEDLSYLVQHRFGSHCCETLFIQAAKIVCTESRSNSDGSLEELLLQAADALQPNLGYLITDRFATHPIRILVMILNGDSVNEMFSKMLASKRKEKIEIELRIDQVQSNGKVPVRFKERLRIFMTAAFQNLDSSHIRALATHSTGNPFLQLCLKTGLELYSKSKDEADLSLFTKLFASGDFEPDSDSAKFVVGLIYDPTGSHLVEILIKHATGKIFKKLYGNIIKERLKSLAKNDVASYIAVRALARLGKDDLVEALDLLVPEIQVLIQRSRLDLVRILFERCNVRQVDSTPIVKSLQTTYGEDEALLLVKMLQFNSSLDARISSDQGSDVQEPTLAPATADVHGSLLTQTMLSTPHACDLIQASLLAQPPSTLVLMSKSPVASRTIQVAMTSPLSPLTFRKRFAPKFFGYVAELAQDAAGSHVADALWQGTAGIHFMKERFAEELARVESELRDSLYGRNVWRNWAMDLYLRRPGDWQAIAKDRKHEQGQEEKASQKSDIQLARARHVKSKAAKSEYREKSSASVVPANA